MSKPRFVLASRSAVRAMLATAIALIGCAQPKSASNVPKRTPVVISLPGHSQTSGQTTTAAGETSSATAATTTPVEQAKTAWRVCVERRVPLPAAASGGEFCDAMQRCVEECEKSGRLRMDEAHFSDLDLEGCAKVQTRADFEAKCSAIGDYIEGRVSEEVREDQPSGDSVSRADVDRCKEDRGCVLQYRSGQGNVPNGHEFAARYAFLVARCTVVLDGSHSCDELAGVIQNGGWGGCIGSVCYRGGRTEIYKLSAAERDVGMAALNVAGPKLDDAAWAELEASGDLAKCKTPTTSADCDSVARYASAFAQGHHSLDATALLQSSERTRKRLHVSECQAEQNALSKEAGAFARMPSVTGSGCYQYCRALGVADASCYSRCDMSGVGEAGAQLQEHARRITQSCDCKKGVCH